MYLDRSVKRSRPLADLILIKFWILFTGSQTHFLNFSIKPIKININQNRTQSTFLRKPPP
uniref:Uncharacterized protein n=1 Tax=Rhizophora mucronata TaxID=61149 RepID=A0A2P2NDX9_RHIMU